MQKKLYPEIILPRLGADKFSSYGDKGYVIAFVYSNKGNFVLKGFSGELDIKLKELVSEGYKFYYRYNYINGGKTRYSNIAFWKKDVWCFTPEKRKSKHGRNINKFEFRKSSEDFFKPSKLVLALKRLPNRWIPQFEKL